MAVQPNFYGSILFKTLFRESFFSTVRFKIYKILIFLILALLNSEFRKKEILVNIGMVKILFF